MQEDHSRRQRKPWHGEPGRPSIPKKTLEQVLDDIYNSQKFIIEYHRPDTKREHYERLKLSKTTYNHYLEYGGIPHPFPPRDHLVYAVDGSNGRLLWMSDSVVQVIGRPRDQLIGETVSKALCGGADLRQSMPEIFELAEQLRAGYHQLPVDMHLVRADGAHVPVRLSVTYGRVYDNFFVDGEVTGEASLPLERDTFNVEPYVLGRNEVRARGSNALEYVKGLRNYGQLAAAMLVSYGMLDGADGRFDEKIRLIGCSIHRILGG